jgi:hypothetical protein
MYTFEYTTRLAPIVYQGIVYDPLPEHIAELVLLNKSCHVDHEGFDLNEIEQEYYKHNNVSLVKDPTWYKDGGMENGTNAIILPWFEQSNREKLIIDHSHFVFRYPIMGEAREQILKYAVQRPELLRILSVQFKCGLDLCIDYFSDERVEPIVHVEWDFESINDLQKASCDIESIIAQCEWMNSIPAILRYNQLARKKRIDAFAQADTRSMLLFGEKSYKLLATL